MNSNWGYQWAPSLFSNPCSESYPGAEAFEAVETKAVADYLTGSPNNVRAFIDVHSYGQLCTFDQPHS
jgi:extracellular matrix protein 14